MKFKSWLENAYGSQGAVVAKPPEPEQVGYELVRKGSGAFKTYSKETDPPLNKTNSEDIQIKKKAVIILGNPKYINNKIAHDFYHKLKNLLHHLGYSVSFDPGEEYTVPQDADLWLGHSRGCARLQFAPPHTKTIAIGHKSSGAINHPNDKAMEKGDVPDKWHFTLSEPMVKMIVDILSPEKI